MEEGDANGDGEIDFDEFQDMMKKLVGGPNKNKQHENEDYGELSNRLKNKNKNKGKFIKAEELDKANPFR